MFRSLPVTVLKLQSFQKFRNSILFLMVAVYMSFCWVFFLFFFFALRGSGQDRKNTMTMSPWPMSMYASSSQVIIWLPALILGAGGINLDPSMMVIPHWRSHGPQRSWCLGHHHYFWRFKLCLHHLDHKCLFTEVAAVQCMNFRWQFRTFCEYFFLPLLVRKL